MEQVQGIVKIGLAILMFVCLMDMPYGYYEFVRFSAMAVFILLAFFDSKVQRGEMVIIYILLALLFQPFYKVALGRTLWNIVDVIVGVWLIYSTLNAINKNKAS